MIRRLLILLTVAFWGCTPGHNNKNTGLVDSTTSINVDKHRSRVHSIRKCEQNNLSNQFNLEVDVQGFSDTAVHYDSCFINLFIKDKQTNERLDTISITSPSGFVNLFASCDTVMSLTTGFHSKRDIVDNDFGYIVVADLNFDTKDDIAVMSDVSSVGGPFYSFFIQGDFKKFSLDQYLTDSVKYFPSIIDNQKQRLTVFEHASVCCTAEEVYQFDRLTGKWKHIIHKLHRD